MPLKKVEQYAIEVAAMGFDAISKDNELRNAVSKALEKALNKDQFLFLNDKNRDPLYLFNTYIKNNNSVNIAGALLKKCADAVNNPAALAAVMQEVTMEVKNLFKTNIKPNLVSSPAFRVWVGAQNLPAIKTNAAKLSKVLGIEDTKNLTEAIVQQNYGDKAEAAKIMKKIETQEKAKDLYKAMVANLAKAGLA
jgi:hypothetical protein